MNRVNDTRTALVTGANKGIGFAIAQGLGKLGFRAAVGARDTGRRDEAVKRLQADGVDAFGVALDVTSDESVAAAAKTVEHMAGRLDVLVNNAGISGRFDDGAQDPTTLDLDVLRTVLDTNVFGVVRVTNAMLPLLYRAPSPRIVNVSTTMASLTLQAGPLLAAYASSKTMLNSLTVQYARRLAETNVIVNACCPGHVATDFTGDNAPRTPEQAPGSRSNSPLCRTTGHGAASSTTTARFPGERPADHRRLRAGGGPRVGGAFSQGTNGLASSQVLARVCASWPVPFSSWRQAGRALATPPLRPFRPPFGHTRLACALPPRALPPVSSMSLDAPGSRRSTHLVNGTWHVAERRR